MNTFRYASLTPIIAAVLLRVMAVSVQAQDLGLFVTADSDVKSSGDRITYTLTATNTISADLSDITVEVQLPEHIFSFSGTTEVLGGDLGCLQSCSAGEIATWTIGTLAPGESRTVILVTNIDTAAPSGEVLEIIVTESTRQVSASQEVIVDATPLLVLGVSPSVGPAEVGEPFTYTLTVGNVGSASPTDVVLRMNLPVNASFVHASDGGLEQNGVVTWNIGTLGAGASREVQVSVAPDADLSHGSVMEAMAELDSGLTTEQIVRASVATPIGEREPLHLAYGVSETALGRGDFVEYTLTATNTGPVDLGDVIVEVLLPPSVNSFSGTTGVLGGDLACLQSCSASEIANWNIGTLAPGESRAVAYRIRITNDAPPGRVLRSSAAARSASTMQITAAQDVAVDPTPLLTLAMTPDSGPAEAGEPFTYTLTVGNVGSASPTSAVLRAQIPEGTSLVDATCGWNVNGDVVSWDLSTVGVGSGDRFRLTVMPDAVLPDGGMFESRGELRSGIETEQIVRGLAVTSIGGQGPLSVNYAVTPTSLGPSEQLSFTLTALNTGPVDLANVVVEVLLPPAVESFSGTTDVLGGDLVCLQSCTANEIAYWNIGTLAPDETQTISFDTNVGAAAQPGRVLQSRIATSATGVNQIVITRDALTGSLINSRSAQAVITHPADGAAYRIGGVGEDDTIPQDSSLTVEWEAPCDPEDDQLTYAWQLSSTPDFDVLLADESSAEGGTATRYATNFGALAEILDSNDVELGSSVTLYHRVVTRDAGNTVFGDPITIVLTRGTIVGVEFDPTIPQKFALHGNYPNPFNPTTTFRFDLAHSSDVQLTVFDALGRRVVTLVDRRMPAGTYRYEWNADGVPSGLYVYRLDAGSFKKAKTMILMK